MKKIIFLLKKILLILLFILIQIDFISLLPYPLNTWQIYLSFIVTYLILFDSYYQIIWWSIVFGIFLNLFSSYSIFIIPSTLALVIVLNNFFLKKFIIGRSWQTIFILSIFTTVLYNLVIWYAKVFFDNLLFSHSNLLTIINITTLFWEIILNFIGSLLFLFLFKKIKRYE